MVLMKLFAGQRHENRHMDMGNGEEREDKMNGESRMEAYTLPSVK